MLEPRSEVRREVVKLGIDFRSIPVDMGDGVEWDFTPDPSPQQWTAIMVAIRAFGEMGESEGDFDETTFGTALETLSRAMAGVLSDPSKRDQWIARGYGLGPQQAVSQALMETWTGFPTSQPSPSGEGSNPVG